MEKILPQHLRSCTLPLALAYMYLAWGGTYLGVKFALPGMPPFFLSGSRFFLAGLMLLTLIKVTDRAGFRVGSLKEWGQAGLIGTLLLVFGIGSGNWAQQYVSSSFAALVFGALPLWIVLIDWLRPGGQAPGKRVAVGLCFGFVGVCLILAPSGLAELHHSLLINLVLLAASLSWATGAVASRYCHAEGSPLLPMARQMIVAGALLLLAAAGHGDFSQLHAEKLTLPVWLGFAYLVFIGSLSGYPVYIWLMRVSSPARVATIPYVNLIVAVLLGWSLGREMLTPRLLLGAGIIVGAVALVLRAKPEEASPTGD